MQLFRVPLRVLGKGCRARKRTEVVRLLVELQATDRALWIEHGRNVMTGGVDEVLGVGDVIVGPLRATTGGESVWLMPPQRC